MKYRALKNCKFDRKYFVGELIDESVIDPQCLPRALKFGNIEVAVSAEEDEIIKPSEEGVEPSEEGAEASEEGAEASESDSAKEDDEEPQRSRKGRRKAKEVV